MSPHNKKWTLWESNPLILLAKEAWHLAIYGPYKCTKTH